MLDLSTAVLCDFAQVRDRLLFVSSGAVSRLYRQELPSPLGLMVGLVIEVPLEDAGMEHRLRAEVINRHGTVLATLDNTFRVSDAGLFPHEVQQVPLVLSITGVRARTWGTHQVRLYLDDDLVRALTLYVVPAAAPTTTVRSTPAEQRDAGAEGGEPAPEAPEPAPAEEPAPSREPAFGAATAPVAEPEGEDVGLNLDPELDLDVSASPEPEPEPELAPEPEPAPEPEAQQAPSPFRSATIDAAPAQEEAPAPAPARQLFDYDEDDLDADPANRPAEATSGREPSRFSFRYRYEDDEG